MDMQISSWSLQSKVRIKWVVSSLISLSMLWLLFNIVDLTSVINIVRTADPRQSFLVIIFYLCTCLARALRLFLFLYKIQLISIYTCFRLILTHQAVFSLAPSGSGDLLFPFLANKVGNIESKKAVSLLISFRIQDLAMLAAIGAYAVIFILERQGHVQLNQYIPIIIILGIVATFYAAKLEPQIMALLLKMRICLGKISLLPASTIIKKNDLNSINKSNHSLIGIFMSMFLTALSWIFSACTLWAAFNTFNFEVSWEESLYLLAGLNLIGAISFAAIGGLGLAELGLTGLLVFAGTPTEVALPIALVVRPTLLITVLASSCIALIKKSAPNRSSE